ncbi:DUF4381 domain-containing protein [Azoarcus sp. KH32C]|uniref:DUF4381 domain-containing protein n=1 Tax=Azoarcus sp. KH32C TaxID=748247 RepID=UPI0002386AEE|nr:DUF4381 domain-containing protein [Azoarcus sp. KH32C]BAL22714.1 hypothetical protein AZKH_0368 [Azoarcus sp. KH32C]
MNTATVDDLRDIHLPPPSGWWPPEPGWWIVLACVLAAGIWLGRRYWRRRPLRDALHELDSLARVYGEARDPVALAAGISGLLRRYARWRFPQASVAGLTGVAWLQFLDAHGGQTAFVAGAGAVLEDLPYRRTDAVRGWREHDAEPLVALARQWLEHNAP